MLKLLLDEHLSPRIAEQVRRHSPAIDITSVRDWHGGLYCGQQDGPLLNAAHREGRTLLTYDRRTIPDLLIAWGEQGIPHSGVIFVDQQRIGSHDIGRLVKAIIIFWDTYGQETWLGLCLYLA